MTPFDGKQITSYLVSILMFPLIIYYLQDIRKTYKMQKFDLENEDKCQKGDSRAYAIRLGMIDSM